MSKPPLLEYGRPDSKPRRSPLLPASLIALAVLVSGLVAIIAFTDYQNREEGRQNRCSANLRRIGQALALYARDNNGAYPPDLQTLATAQPIGLTALVCPNTSDRTPPTASAICLKGRCSYLYVGAGLTTKANPECVIAIEDPANHGLDGGNVLFDDGHVEWFYLPDIQHLLNELNAGRNPPATLTPNLSQAAAEQDYQKNWKPGMPQLKTGVWRIPTTQPAKPE